MTAGLDPRYERWVRFWLRAFPKRYRAVHTEEILGSSSSPSLDPSAARS